MEEWILNLQDNEWPFTTIDHNRMIVRAVVIDNDGYYYFIIHRTGCATLMMLNQYTVFPEAP